MPVQQDSFTEISSARLAAWIERQGYERWWSVDGDPLLTGRISFPCPGDELAAELRRIDKPLLIFDPVGGSKTRVRINSDEEIDAIAAGRKASERNSSDVDEDRVLVMRWTDSSIKWLLIEDHETTQSAGADAAEEMS